MAIPPVKPGGYGPLDVPRAAELAQIDERLAARGLDSLGADTVTGTLSLAQDPNHPIVHPTFSGGGCSVSAAGAIISTVPGSGGRLVLGDNDYPTYTATRSRSIYVSALEACRSSPAIATSGNKLVVDQASGGVYAAAYSDFVLPIAKPHDGATLFELFVYCFYTASPTIQASVTNLILVRWGVAVGYSGGGSPVILGQYAPGALGYNAGLPITLAMGGGFNGVTFTNNVLDLQTYSYGIFVRFASPPTGANLVFTGYRINYTAIADERFTQ